ncbi:MAG: hypothetical protein ACPGED_07945 [Flavobacteriales bacterium]
MELFAGLIIAVLLGGVIALIFLHFGGRRNFFRTIRKAPLKPITEVKHGELVRIQGKVELVGEALIAPLSGRKCAYFLAEVFERRGNGLYGIPVFQKSRMRGVKFVIRNGKDIAVLDSVSLRERSVVMDRKWESGLFDNLSPSSKKFVHSLGLASQEFFGSNRRLVLKEGVFEPGEKIVVYGKGYWEYSRKHGIDNNGSKVLVMHPGNEEAIYISDHPKAAKD